MNRSITGFRYISTALEHYKATVSKSDEVVDYVKDIPFQVVLTLSGVGRYSIESLKQVEKKLADYYERVHKCSLSYVVSYERTSVERYANIHMAIACGYRVDIAFIEAVLRGWKVNFEIRPVDMERKERLLSYAFKEMNYSSDYNFDLVNCDYYLKPPGNCRERRRLRRMQERSLHGQQERK